MRSALFAAVLSVLAAPLSAAPEVLDGSDANIAPGILQELTVILAREQYLDPNSAQYHDLNMAGRRNVRGESIGDPTHVCGYINLKNQMGAYTGFKPFLMELETGEFTHLVKEPGDIGYAIYRHDFAPMGCDRLLQIPEPS